MITRTDARRLAACLLASSLLAAAAGLSGCSSSRAPLPASQTQAASMTPTASTSASPSATASDTQPPKTDASGAAIGATVTVSGAKKPQIGKIPRPTDATAIEQVKKVVADNDSVKVTSAKVLAMTQDTKGTWWVLLSIVEDQSGPTKAVIVFDGKKWDYAAEGDPIDTSDLPPDVKF